MRTIFNKLIEDKKYLLLCFLWLLFLVWRTSVFLPSTSPPEVGIIDGMAFASHHGYQRGIKARIKRLNPEPQEWSFPLSYSGTFRAYNLPPGEYQIVFTKQGYHPAFRNTTVRAGAVTQIPPVTLERSLGSDYFYHFVHALNIFAFIFLLITGIGTYHLRNADRVATAFLRFCLIFAFWSLWGIVSYVLELLGTPKEIGGHLTYFSLWSYSLIAVSYCHVLAVFPQPILAEKTTRFLSWLYFPALLLLPVEFIRVFFWYRPDYSRFLGFPQQITDSIIMFFFLLYLVLGNAFLLFNLLRVKEKVEQVQLLFLLLAACFPPILFTGTLGVMYLFHLDYFFDSDMLFLTSLSQIVVSVAFAYSLVMFDYIHTNERMVQQERLAFIGLIDAKLTHDIRSFIVIQRNLSDTILKQLRSNKMEDAIQLTEEMQSNTNKTLQLISAIRDELKQLKPHSSSAQIEEMVDEAVEIITFSNSKNINIKKEFSQDLPPIRVERTRFVSALVNLLQNAVDSFNETAKVVSLKTAANTIEITAKEKDGEITLTISDNGCGIPPDKKDKIFDSFYSTKEGNTGLGLFTVKQEIQRYNGDITCLSEPSVGTTMIITLPAEEDNSDSETGIELR